MKLRLALEEKLLDQIELPNFTLNEKTPVLA